MDFSSLSNEQLQALYQQQANSAIGSNESNNAPDTSTVTNKKSGAFGSMQVVQKTQDRPGYGVKASDGSATDTAREGRDYRQALSDKFGDDTAGAGAYNWGPGHYQKWVDSGADMSKLPDETLKYMYNYNQKMGKDTPPASDPSTMSDDDLKAAYSQTQQPTDKGGVISNLGGLGLQAANIIGGAVEAPFVAAHAAYSGIKSGSLSDVVKTGMDDFQKFSPESGLNAMGVDTSGLHSTYGYDLPAQAMDAAFDKAPEFLGNQITDEFARQAGIDPAAYTKVAGPAAKTALQAAMVISPLAEVPHMVGKLTGGKPSAGALEADKISALTPDTAPVADAMGPNEGPQRPPISVDQNGSATDPLGDPNMGSFVERGQAQQAFDRGDLFGDNGGSGTASPYDPNRLSSDVQSPTNFPGRNLRQGEMDFNQIDPAPTLMVNSDGDIGTPSQMREGGAVDVMRGRIAEMQTAKPEVLDPQSGIDHPAQAAPEVKQSLAPDEFQQAIQSLVEKDPNRFSMPADMDAAYSRYTDIVRDDTGTLRTKSKSSAQFVDAVRKEMQDQRLANHPAVKSNQARVDSLQAKLADATAKQAPTMGIERALTKATDTLEKSKTNITKVLGDDPRLPWNKDGVVNMFTFGHLPEMFRSIGAILKALHGMAFKMIDRMIPKNRNLDSTGKIFSQGIKDYANKQASRDWTQTVNEKPVEQLNKIDALRKGIAEYNPYEGQSISPEALKAQMVSAPDISGNIRSKVAQNIVQGGLQLTNFVKHPLIKFVTESVDRAMRNTKQYVKENLIGKDGLRTKMQAMSSDELAGVRNLMELNEGKQEFTPQQMKNAGFSDKQIDYYGQSLREDRRAFDRFNSAREAADLKPVDRRIAHIAGYFMGDFRSIITNKEGKVIAVVAHNLRPAVNTIVKHFIDNHPDGKNLTASPVKLRKLNEAIGSADNRFHGYMEVLNVLKDTNSDVGAVVDAYQNYITKDAQAAMADRARFKSDEAVMGAEGRKAWQSAQKNAVEGARQQLHYLESINKWSEMQDAIRKSADHLADPDINAPNAKALAQDYIDAVQGRNRGPMQKLLNAMMNGTAEAFGVGPSILKNMNNVTKSAMLMKFVGIFKLSHSAVTMLQPLQAMPTINARLAARGADLGMASVNSVGHSLMSSFRMFSGKPADGFESRAAQFMKDNNTADVGMSFHLQNVSKGSAKGEALRHISELNVRVPEVGARTFTFMYYAHMLKDLGLPEKETFLTAHNLMRDAMVDYSPHERSLMFGKMGILGDIASTLTRFKYNQIGQHMVGWHDWRQGGSAAPLLTTIGTSVLLGGMRGVFAYEAANQLTSVLTTFMASHGMMKQPTSLDEMMLKSIHGMNSHLADLLNFGIPSSVGVNLTGSLTNADTIPTDPIGALFPTASEFANLGTSAASLALHPNKNNAQKAATAWMPNSMKGMAENAFFTDSKGNYTNPNTGKLEARRSSSDQWLRSGSFRPLQEGKDSLVARTETSRQSNLNTVRHSILEQAHSDMISNGGKLNPEQIQGYAKRYIDTGSDPQSFVNDLVQFAGMDQNRTRLERAEGIPSNSRASIDKYMNVQRMK